MSFIVLLYDVGSLQERQLSWRGISPVNLRRNMNVRFSFFFFFINYYLWLMIYAHSLFLCLYFICVYHLICCHGSVSNSHYWCGGSSVGFFHELWKDSFLLLGYCRAREVWWSQGWILVSFCLFFFFLRELATTRPADSLCYSNVYM